MWPFKKKENKRMEYVYVFTPQNDITSYELAECLAFIDLKRMYRYSFNAKLAKYANPSFQDLPYNIARHFYP